MRTLQVPRGGVTALAYTPDSRGLLTGDASGAVHRWDLGTGEARLLFRAAGETLRQVAILVASRDGRFIAANCAGIVTVWDEHEGTTLPPLRPRYPEGGGYWGMDISPDSRTLAYTGNGGVLTLWDLWARAALRKVRGQQRMVPSAAFSPDGRFVALAGCGVGRTRLVDVARGEVALTLKRCTYVNVLAFSPTGHLLATAGLHTLRLWDTTTWECRHTISAAGPYIQRLAFHPSGTLVATAGDGPLVSLWDTACGRPCGRFDWQVGKVLALAFSPDGMTAAAGGSNRRFVVWDVEDVAG
jgi:WD40 repeat protein